MAQPMATKNSRRSLTLFVVLSALLDVAMQFGLDHLSAQVSSPLFWLVGTPIGYTLIALLLGFCATGGLARSEARGRGSQVGTIGALSGVILAAVIATVFILIGIYTPGPSARGVHFPEAPNVLALFLIILWFVPLFLVSNLLGLALASLGGSLGGVLRGRVSGIGSPDTNLSGSHIPGEH